MSQNFGRGFWGPNQTRPNPRGLGGFRRPSGRYPQQHGRGGLPVAPEAVASAHGTDFQGGVAVAIVALVGDLVGDVVADEAMGKNMHMVSPNLNNLNNNNSSNSSSSTTTSNKSNRSPAQSVAETMTKTRKGLGGRRPR